MLHKTEGIVFTLFPYGDRYAIAHIFTRDFGRVAYLLPRARSKKSKLKSALFSPLSVLHMEVEHLPLREIQRLKDVERQFPIYDLTTNGTKIAVAFFLSEFFSSVFRASDENMAAFDFAKRSIWTLEMADKGVANFHLACMIGLIRYLGIEPNLQATTGSSYFDLLNGEFAERRPDHNHYLISAQSTYLLTLCRMNYRNMHLFRFSRVQRNEIIDRLLSYYRLHLYDFPPLKSLSVLRELS